MGKKGDLLRAQKRATTTYSFTLDQLVMHDREVERRVRKQCEAEHNEELVHLIALLISLPMVVLIEQFGWAPPYDRRSYRYRTVRFGDLLADEIGKIFGSQPTTQDIRKYNARAKELYGIEFKVI